MTSETKRWESLKAEYLRQVELAISSVKHPRRHEVLEDVRSHLDQRFADLGPDRQTPENMEKILEEMGPASDYAELLDSEAVPFQRNTPQKNHFRIVLIYSILFILGLFLAFGAAYNFQDFNQWFCTLFLPLLIPVLVIKLVVFGYFKFYQGWGLPFWKIISVNWIGNLWFVALFFVFGYVLGRNISSLNDWFPFDQFRQVIFLLDWFFTLVLVWVTVLFFKKTAK